MNPGPSIAQLRNFLRVAEHGSFHSAAGDAFRSQPAISKSIQALESQLGRQLFEPAHRTELTALGRDCKASVRETLMHYDRTVQTMLSLARGEMGSVAVAAIGGLASNWLPKVVAKLMELHPEVNIQLLDDNTQNITRMVLSGMVDFGLCATVSNPQLTFTPLLQDDFGLVCRADHVLASRKSIRWKDLGSLRLAATTAHRQLGDTPERALLQQKPLEVFNMLTLLSLLEQGVAQTVLPKLALPAMIAGLTFVPLVAPRKHREIGLLRIKEKSLSPTAELVAKMIGELANQTIDRHVRKAS